jgi:hypothetical protein
LRALAPRGRIDAIADPGSIRTVDASFDAPRPSPHLARWRIAAQDDDGIVIARAATSLSPSESRMTLPRTRVSPPPEALVPLYAIAEPVDPLGWLWRIPSRPTWMSRGFGAATLGPDEAHALDAALIAHLAASDTPEGSLLIHVGDSSGHEASRNAELLCISQYLAQHAAVLALLRSRGVRIRGLLTTLGHSAAFFATALQADEVYALSGARVVAMDPAAIARVLRLPERQIATLVESDPVVGQPVAHFARWGAITAIMPATDSDRLRSLTLRDER